MGLWGQSWKEPVPCGQSCMPVTEDSVTQCPTAPCPYHPALALSHGSLLRATGAEWFMLCLWYKNGKGCESVRHEKNSLSRYNRVPIAMFEEVLGPISRGLHGSHWIAGVPFNGCASVCNAAFRAGELHWPRGWAVVSISREGTAGMFSDKRINPSAKGTVEYPSTQSSRQNASPNPCWPGNARLGKHPETRRESGYGVLQSTRP